MKNNKKILSIVLILALVFTFVAGCGNNNQTNDDPMSDPMYIPVKGDDIVTTDYSKEENWLNIPDTNYDVDIFYLYPTAWTRNEGEPYYCDIDNESMVAGAEMMYNAQATAFETVGNIYAPYYRQLDAVWLVEEPLETREDYFCGLPYEEAVAALEYYLENYNDGKPFILAGHSQGSAVTKCILKYYMKDHPEVYEKMIAAYVIGYFVTEEELEEYPHLKFVQGADDTGVIVSWNAEAPGTENNPLAPKGSISINPISWTLTDEAAPASDNLGSEIFNRAAGSITKATNLADATVNLERGTVVCSTVDVDTYGPGALFPRGVYHAQDYGFYYYNIRQNAADRVAAYMAQNK